MWSKDIGAKDQSTDSSMQRLIWWWLIGCCWGLLSGTMVGAMIWN